MMSTPDKGSPDGMVCTDQIYAHGQSLYRQHIGKEVYTVTVREVVHECACMCVIVCVWLIYLLFFVYVQTMQPC